MADSVKDRLHAEALKHLEFAAKLGTKPYYEYDNMDALRRVRGEILSHMLEDVDFHGKILELRVPSRDVNEGIPITIYQPSDVAQLPCILIYFHGGGLTVGSRTDVDPMCKTVSQEAKCIVVNVEYRLSPEVQFPAHLDDADAVTKWVIDNKKRLGGQVSSPVGVAGDSAGGTLASHAAHDIPGLAFQVLIYPRVSYRQDFPSTLEFANGPVLTLKLIQWFDALSHSTDADRRDVRGNVLHRQQFDHVPPTLIILAEIDPIRDESYAYKEKLEEAAVKCDILEVKGVPHMFFTLNGIYKEATQKAYGRIVNFIQQFQETTQ